ncbi:amidohydrolase [Anoxynatronum buryatiense]|uniref:Amidohydrolase 3 domain-containing protein n=1 Tax=Anoxynatronum buryatiense TaxID=489973 RepID=A0AA45WVD9_9CLOT|nr:amidohydrolase [Anoxynatronum buryatiense]SMP52253.1 hypothetical protein SAMN06296020_104207 [Anoxynatronum buryatiense]
MKNDRLLFFNGEILTLTETMPQADWLLVADGKITAVGRGSEWERYQAGATSVDLAGRTLIPGLIDSHVHLMETALNEVGINVGACGSVDEIIAHIRNNQGRHAWGKLIHCVGLEEVKLKEKRMPTRFELDTVITDRMLWISSVEYHVSVVNTLGLRWLDLPFNLEGIQRNEAGVPTGVLTGRANFFARKKLLGLTTDQTREKGVRQVLSRAIEKGVTTINAMEGGFLFHDQDALYVLRSLEKMPIDVAFFYQTTDVAKVVALGLDKIGGCIFVDGSFGAHTAALDYPYSDRGESMGTLFFHFEEIRDFVSESMKHNLTVTLHAIGTRAIRLVLEAYREGRRLHPCSTSILRIEHFELPNQDLIEQAVLLKVILSMQPAYEYFWGGSGGMYEERLGEQRRCRTNPLKTLWKQGCIIAGGSDSDVTPIDPLLGIHAAVNHPTESERLAPLEALAMFTLNGAKAIGQQGEKGTLEVGRLADLCILEENPLRVNPEKIKDIQVTATIKKGKILFERGLQLNSEPLNSPQGSLKVKLGG